MQQDVADNDRHRSAPGPAGRSAMSIVLFTIFALSLGLMAGTARADDEASCRARNGAAAVTACTHLIESGKAKGTTLYLHYNNRGGAHQSIGAAGDHRRAVEDFGAAINVEPKLPYAFINRGVSWAALGAYDRAIADFGQALRVDPENALAYNNRGGAHRDRGEFDRAMADFNKAISLDPKFADARFNRGTVYIQKEAYDSAIADYTVVIRQNARDVPALAARGRAWSGKGEFKRARSDFEAALAAPASDQQSQAVKDAVRELLRALIEKQAADELEAARRRQAAAEKSAADKQALAEKNAAKQTSVAAPQLAPPAAPAPTVPKLQKADRLALVIGNAAYLPELGALDNPRSDAKDVAKTLTELGFEVWLRLDLGHVEMKDVLDQFARAARDAGTAIIYYAGHGFQFAGSNYLAPVDAPVTDDRSVADHVSLNSVMSALRAERGIRIVIIDACRNNLALERSAGARTSDAPPVSIARGFAPVIADTWVGGGMLIAFATLPGDVASEGAGRNSPFTHALVKHLPTPGLELRHLFVRVRADVVAATGNRQVPQVSDALNGEYIFRAVNRRDAPAKRH